MRAKIEIIEPNFSAYFFILVNGIEKIVPARMNIGGKWVTNGGFDDKKFTLVEDANGIDVEVYKSKVCYMLGSSTHGGKAKYKMTNFIKSK